MNKKRQHMDMGRETQAGIIQNIKANIHKWGDNRLFWLFIAIYEHGRIKHRSGGGSYTKYYPGMSMQHLDLQAETRYTTTEIETLALV